MNNVRNIPIFGRIASKEDKIVIWLAAVLLLIAVFGMLVRAAEPGGFLYPLQSYFAGRVSYVIDVSHEIGLLEADLEKIAGELEDGSLTEEEAQAAQERIADRIATINSALLEADRGATLTPQMRDTLRLALARLTSILSTYRETLASLEEVAGESISVANRPRLNPRGGGGTRSIVSLLADTASLLAEHSDVEISDESEKEDGEEETTEDTPDASEDTNGTISPPEVGVGESKTPDTADIADSENVAPEEWRTQVLLGLGVLFQYRVDEHGYRLIRQEEHEDDDQDLVVSYVIMLEDDYEAMQEVQNSEGPPTINLSVFRNDDDLPIEEWVDEKSGVTGVNSAFPFSQPRFTIVNGYEALTYIADGLYPTDTYIIQNEPFVYIITGSYIDTDSQIRRDFLAFLDRLSFSAVGGEAAPPVPEEEATTTEETSEEGFPESATSTELGEEDA